MRTGHRVNKRLIAICAFLAAVVFMLAMIWSFTSRNGYESNAESQKAAAAVRSFVSRYFETDPRDMFWTVTLNQILRKLAHFAEYLFLGAFACALLNCVFGKCLPAFAASLFFCAAVAVADEFRQVFISGRTPRLFDVKVDISGALFGIVLAAIAFAVYRRIRRLEEKLRSLETRDGR